MKFSSAFLVAITITCFALGSFFLACDGVDDELYPDKPMMQEDGNNYAKNMTADQDCAVDDLLVQDCADACTCCNFGNQTGLEDCVLECDGVLFKYFDYPAHDVDIDNFKECVVGCFSVCEKTDPGTNCWAECKKYVE